MGRAADEYPTFAEIRFAFFLAGRLHMTVAELRQRVKLSEFRQWQAYYAQLAREQPKQS